MCMFVSFFNQIHPIMQWWLRACSFDRCARKNTLGIFFFPPLGDHRNHGVRMKVVNQHEVVWIWMKNVFRTTWMVQLKIFRLTHTSHIFFFWKSRLTFLIWVWKLLENPDVSFSTKKSHDINGFLANGFVRNNKYVLFYGWESILPHWC